MINDIKPNKMNMIVTIILSLTIVYRESVLVIYDIELNDIWRDLNVFVMTILSMYNHEY
jgi:hypothetical protein